MIEGRFMTLCFATWHRGRRKLRVANAGQEQPFLFHGGHCEKIRLAGFPLGIFEEATYDQRSFILDTGDVVVFHSDGIGDTQNPTGEFFGHDRVCKLIAEHHDFTPDGLADRILEELDRFSGGAHPADDRTLVVLKVK
jgi:sigma-B regulation protein RsbU (phosphoserine phosphatase)